jgi:purine-binding chemotaxis protein CheW
MKNADRGETLPAAARQYLIFRIESRLYALPAGAIAEVIRTPLTARVPQAPKALLGVANLRGVVLPVVSLRGLIGMDEAAAGGGSRSIVLDGDMPIAITVDAVETLTLVEIAGVESQPANLNGEPGERLIAAFSLGGSHGAVKVLDIQALLSDAFAQRDRAVRKTAERENVIAREQPQAITQTETLVTFTISEQEFAFPLATVQEVVSLPQQITAAPRAEASVLGMMAFRDRLLPLLSLRALLGFASAPPTERREKVVIASIGGASVGLVADRARAIIAADPELIEPAPAIIAARMGGEARVKSIYRGEGGKRLISILAPEQLFREDVMQRLNAGQDATRPEAQRESAGEERKFLVFRLGDDEYALPVEAVDEVARVPAQITRVPKTPKFLEGVVNLRGEVLPVVDQRRRFDLPKVEQGEGRRLIVVRSERHRAGLIVDSVSQVLGASTDAIADAPHLTGDITRLVRGVINLERDGRIVLVLDPSELLTRAERGILDTFENKTRKSS